MKAGGECDAAVTARMVIGLAKSRECGEVLNEKRLHAKLKEIVHNNHVKLEILHGIKI